MGLYKEALSSNPDDPEIQLKTADAINAVMRIKTNANTILIEGSLDTPANKALWAEQGPEAFRLAKSAYEKLPPSARSLAVYTDSFMFVSSSKGILSQALTGVGSEFKRLANELLKYPEHDSGVGHALLGAFYLVAPWPVGNKEAAMTHMEKAAAIRPSRRNLYYVGVAAFRLGLYKRAVEAFQGALAAKCGSETEMDFGEFMLQQSAIGLERSRALLAKQR